MSWRAFVQAKISWIKVIFFVLLGMAIGLIFTTPGILLQLRLSGGSMNFNDVLSSGGGRNRGAGCIHRDGGLGSLSK